MFTTPCFIRKNTPELWEALEALGYQQSRVINKDSYLCIVTTNFKEYSKYTTITQEMFDTKNPHVTWNCCGRIDCGTNEELFLAIAALRDDSDKNQWFTDGIRWFKCPYERVEECRKNAGNYGNKLIDYSMKATVEELIKHFN